MFKLILYIFYILIHKFKNYSSKNICLNYNSYVFLKKLYFFTNNENL